VSRARTIIRRALLGYLVAEWVGVLLAYALALLSFSFLIGYVVTISIPGLFVIVPVVVLAASAGLFLLWKAFGVPRALFRQARRASEGIPIAWRESPPVVPRAVARTGEWHATAVVNRVGAVMSLDENHLGVRSGGLRLHAAELTVRDLSPRPRLRPRVDGFAPVFQSPERIPVAPRDGGYRASPIRIVDLSSDTPSLRS
jgi:hypothetical protein